MLEPEHKDPRTVYSSIRDVVAVFKPNKKGERLAYELQEMVESLRVQPVNDELYQHGQRQQVQQHQWSLYESSPVQPLHE